MGQTGHGNWISSAEGLMLARFDCVEVSFTGGAGFLARKVFGRFADSGPGGNLEVATEFRRGRAVDAWL